MFKPAQHRHEILMHLPRFLAYNQKKNPREDMVRRG